MKFVESNEDFSAMCEVVNCERLIAVDTEFVRESDVPPLFCLLQIAVSNEIFIADPLNIDFALLKQPFENIEIKKIFHDARQDVEIFRSHGIDVKNYYDTQLAEMLISVKETESYRALVQKYIGKTLRKSHTLSDWTQRPLSKNQVKYAVEDVCFLREIHDKQMKKIQQLGRENWLKSAAVPEEDHGNSPWFRALNDWCIEKAQKENISREEVVHAKLIGAVCKKGLDFIRKLQNSRNMDRGKFAEEFLAYAAATVKRVPKADPAPSDIVCCLHTLLYVCARRNSVCPSMIARRSDLELLAKREGEKSACMQGWRFEIFGQYALKLLSGEIRLSIKNNEVVII